MKTFHSISSWLSLQQIHGLVHLVELYSIARRQIYLGKPAVPDPELGFGPAQAIGDHCEQRPFVRRPELVFPDRAFDRLLHAQQLPVFFDHHDRTHGKRPDYFHVGGKSRRFFQRLSVPFLERIDDRKAAYPGYRSAEAHKLVSVQLVGASEAVHDFGHWLPGDRVSLVVRQLVVLHHGAVLVFSPGRS